MPGSVNHEQRAERAWPVLADRAAAYETISYGDLAKRIGIHHRPLRHVLGLIQAYCQELKLPPLTILVVHAGKGEQPGSGFIAWDVDTLAEGRELVYQHNWVGLENPFHYAHGGETTESLAHALCKDPGTAADIYRRVKVRGIAQEIFRKALMAAYSGACSFCGLSFRETLDAAHIFPWAVCGDGNRMNVRNGILLCANHHRMFDLGYLAINAELVIESQLPVRAMRDRYGEMDILMSTRLHHVKMRILARRNFGDANLY